MKAVMAVVAMWALLCFVCANAQASSNWTSPTDDQWTNQSQMDAVAIREDTVTAEYEIVIARYRENATTMAWLSEIPDFYQITIYNTVGSSSSSSSWESISFN